MTGSVRIQVQTPSQNWRVIGSCQNNPTVIANRLDQEKMRHKMPVRAVDSMGRLLDMR